MLGRDSHPILTCAAAKAHEAALLRDEAAEWDAMQRAGRAIARHLAADAREIGGVPAEARVLVLAGKGHNGGDALLAAATLLADLPAARVDVLLGFGAESLRPLARRSLATLHATGGARVRELTVAELKREFASYDVCLVGEHASAHPSPCGGGFAERAGGLGQRQDRLPRRFYLLHRHREVARRRARQRRLRRPRALPRPRVLPL